MLLASSPFPLRDCVFILEKENHVGVCSLTFPYRLLFDWQRKCHPTPQRKAHLRYFSSYHNSTAVISHKKSLIHPWNIGSFGIQPDWPRYVYGISIYLGVQYAWGDNSCIFLHILVVNTLKCFFPTLYAEAWIQLKWNNAW